MFTHVSTAISPHPLATGVSGGEEANALRAATAAEAKDAQVPARSPQPVRTDAACPEDACPQRFSWFFYWIPKEQTRVNLKDLQTC